MLLPSRVAGMNCRSKSGLSDHARPCRLSLAPTAVTEVKRVTRSNGVVGGYNVRRRCSMSARMRHRKWHRNGCTRTRNIEGKVADAGAALRFESSMLPTTYPLLRRARQTTIHWPHGPMLYISARRHRTWRGFSNFCRVTVSRAAGQRMRRLRRIPANDRTAHVHKSGIEFGNLRFDVEIAGSNLA